MGLSTVKESNARAASEQSRLVALFVGSTSGIAYYTLKQFAKHAVEPRVYSTGRSQEAGSRIEAECKALNEKRQFTFIKADTTLIKVVDEVCEDIKTKVDYVNLLFLTVGALVFGQIASEGLDYAMALGF
ncbi:hypothetical protein CBS101457_006189 [Exobasidium rhododendri]|nr:hypothetical protein CBS101457_006189 [Exobasidium rhododendri]